MSFYLLNVWLKASLIRGYVCECIYIHHLKVKLLLVLWCMTGHLKKQRNTDKFDEHKIDIKAPILCKFKTISWFLKTGSDDLHDKQNFGFTLVVGEVTS